MSLTVKKSSVDLTQGPVLGQILRFAVPLLIGEVLQNLYNSVDALVVGRCVGSTALAAVSSGNDISQFLVSFFTGLSAGSGILFSKSFGAKDYEELHDGIHTSVTFSILLGLVMSTLGIIFTPALLRIVACPADVFPESLRYLRVYFIGVLFTSIYNVGSGILRAVGDSRHPLLYLFIASTTNIVLDVVFVRFFHMGVTGAALATIVSQLLSVGLVFRQMLVTPDVYRLVLRDLRIRKDLLIQVINYGFPAAMQSCLLQLSNLFVQRYVNQFGSTVMAGYGSARKVEKFILMTANAVGLATSTFVAQNCGAKKYRRCFRGIRTCFAISLAVLILFSFPLLLMPEVFVGIFTDEPAVLEYGVLFLNCVAPLFIFQTIHQVLPNAVRGFGHPKAVMILSLLGMVGMRQLYLGIIMRAAPSLKAVFYCYPVGWFFSCLFVLSFYFVKVRPHYIALAREEQPAAAD